MRLPHDQPGLRRRYFTSANGSVHETVAAVDLALAIGAVTPDDAEVIQALAHAARARDSHAVKQPGAMFPS